MQVYDTDYTSPGMIGLADETVKVIKTLAENKHVYVVRGMFTARSSIDLK